MDTKTEMDAQHQPKFPVRHPWLRHYHHHQKKYTSLIIICSLAAAAFSTKTLALPWMPYFHVFNAGYHMGRLVDMFLNPIDPEMIDRIEDKTAQIEENTAKLRWVTDQLSQYTQRINTHYDNVNRMLEESRSENEHKVEDEL
ncbi:hypothetical protein HII31_01145 [Pseudocercospora fuligena]|uniref:Uncharacterized protein n=1 Tax=Pseudocercospora fuligena TaxID=685502 RepID=A0A8H6VMK5_9PEZI|nr:hypothetical protein HII31_01145 [Pseudocercospora fuligena]